MKQSSEGTAQVFENLVEKELLSLKEKLALPQHSLSITLVCRRDKPFLTSKLSKDIVIREADKVGAVVVLNDRDYKTEAFRQLTYRMLRSYPTQIF